MKTEERLYLLNEAYDKLGEVIELIRDAVKGTGVESAADAYIIAHLSNWKDGINPYDYTAIPRLSESILQNESEEEEDNNE